MKFTKPEIVKETETKWLVKHNGETIATISRRNVDGQNGYSGEMTPEFGGFKFRNLYTGENAKEKIAARAVYRVIQGKIQRPKTTTPENIENR